MHSWTIDSRLEKSGEEKARPEESQKAIPVGETIGLDAGIDYCLDTSLLVLVQY